jgi:hypothetical protein
MSETQEYIEAVIELAQSERTGNLTAVLDARIRGSEEPVVVSFSGGKRKLRSPALEIDEPDRNALIYEIYRVIRDIDQPNALETLRRAAVDLLMHGLNRGEDLEYLDAVARLVGHTRVVDSEDLRRLVQQQLYGFLANQLDRPFHRLIEFDGSALALATLSLDIWLAVMPVQPDWSDQQTLRIARLVDHSVEQLETGYLPLAPRLELLSLAYRALTKVQPTAAGARLWRLCRLVARYGDEKPVLRRRWLATCRKQGVAFSAVPRWRQGFLRGVWRTPWSDIEEDAGLGDLLRRALVKLDGMWSDVAPVLETWHRCELEAPDGFVRPAPALTADRLTAAATTIHEHYAKVFLHVLKRYAMNSPIPRAT